MRESFRAILERHNVWHSFDQKLKECRESFIQDTISRQIKARRAEAMHALKLDMTGVNYAVDSLPFDDIDWEEFFALTTLQRHPLATTFNMAFQCGTIEEGRYVPNLRNPHNRPHDEFINEAVSGMNLPNVNLQASAKVFSTCRAPGLVRKVKAVCDERGFGFHTFDAIDSCSRGTVLTVFILTAH